MYLLDTDALSSLRRRRRHPQVERWMADQNPSDVYISAMTVGEIERGIVRQERRNPPFARDLIDWLRGVIDFYGDRILNVDMSIARRWGRLSAQIGHEGTDLIIAATDLEHNLTVVTRNVRHFQPTGARILNPIHIAKAGGLGSRQ